MSSYFLKVYRVVPSEPTKDWQGEIDPVVYRNQGNAQDFAAWCKGDQGLTETVIEEHEIDCLMIDGTVYVPEYVN